MAVYKVELEQADVFGTEKFSYDGHGEFLAPSVENACLIAEQLLTWGSNAKGTKVIISRFEAQEVEEVDE